MRNRADATYGETFNFYSTLEKRTNNVHRAATATFGALREFIVSQQPLLQALAGLADAETGPNKAQINALRSFLEQKFACATTSFRLLLDLTAKCTEMSMQYQQLANSNANARRASERVRNSKPAQLQDAQEAFKQCNRELVRMCAQFEKSRATNYKELIATAAKCFGYASAKELERVPDLEKAAQSLHLNSVFNEVCQHLSGIELGPGETLQRLMGIEDQFVGGVEDPYRAKTGLYSTGNRGFRVHYDDVE